MPELYVDFNPMMQNMQDLGWPEHIQDAIKQMMMSDKKDFSAEVMNEVINRMGSIIKHYEQVNPGVRNPLASPDHPSNFDPMKPRNYGTLPAGNFNPMQAAVSSMLGMRGGF